MADKAYSELLRLPTFQERFEYLAFNGKVADETFGAKRRVNQDFYRSYEWKRIRDLIIIRDGACDLGIQDRLIGGPVYIHHINPITLSDLETNYLQKLTDPENLICVSFETHNAIHYGDYDLVSKEFVEREPNDTCPWKKNG